MSEQSISPKTTRGAPRFNPMRFSRPQPRAGPFQSIARGKSSFRRAKTPMQFSTLKKARLKSPSYPNRARKPWSLSWVLMNSWVKDA
jgi:hypothetical protein